MPKNGGGTYIYRYTTTILVVGLGSSGSGRLESAPTTTSQEPRDFHSIITTMEKEIILDYVLDSEELLEDLPDYGDYWYRNRINKVKWNLNELKRILEGETK